ncbi:hypothetical protein HHI36_010549 [Cryptolaemus montrouzieri]|uniref:Uncharacterized protein n=1 Tax=Cryptolaemus montrouzieri TaxID=559131 RepID=A0ABD2MJ74_9CUCU
MSISTPVYPEHERAARRVLHGLNVTFVVAYAPSDDERVGTKQEFYEELEEILTGIGVQSSKNEVRRLIKREKKNAWDQHCQQIETLIGGKRCSEVWTFIRSLESSNKDKVHISIIEPEEWKDHYASLLQEKRTEYRDESPTKNIRVQGEKVEIGVETTKKVVMSMKTGKSSGPEGIYTGVKNYLTYVWKKSDDLDDHMIVCGFARQESERGGVSIYAKKGIRIQPIRTDTIEKHFEICAAKIFGVECQSNTYIISLYSLQVYKLGENIIIYGGMNIDILKMDRNGERLINLMSEFNIVPHIFE